MTIRLYTGSIEGVPYTAAHTKDAAKQFSAAVVMGFMSPGDFPTANKVGWMSASLDPDIPQQTVVERLASVGPVEIVDPTRQQAEALLGSSAVEVLLDESELFRTADL